MSTCRSCGQPILWCRTETGKRIPLDPEPCADGNLVIITGEVLPTARSISRSVYRPDQPLYRSHFASCKDAAKHRHKKPKPKLPPPGPVLFEEPDQTHNPQGGTS